MQTKVQMIKEILKSAFGLFIFSIGVFLTIQADIGLRHGTAFLWARPIG